MLSYLSWTHMRLVLLIKSAPLRSLRPARLRTAVRGLGTRAHDRSEYKHWVSIQTRWKDNDQYGHVNNAEYYSYFDTVINHFLINNGRLDPLSSKTIGLCIESKCNYFSPVEFPCVVDAGMYISHKGRTSVKYEVGIFKQGSSLPSAHGHFVHVFVDSETRKPVPFGADMEIAMASIAIPPYPDER